MKPVNQDIFVNDPQGRVGNCLQAAVASILELNLNEVPHFVSDPRDDWRENMIEWLKTKGYGFFGTYSLFYESGYCIACGMSPRGVVHAVIYLNGELAHDPHPSRSGIEKADYYYIINKL